MGPGETMEKRAERLQRSESHVRRAERAPEGVDDRSNGEEEHVYDKRGYEDELESMLSEPPPAAPPPWGGHCGYRARFTRHRCPDRFRDRRSGSGWCRGRARSVLLLGPCSWDRAAQRRSIAPSPPIYGAPRQPPFRRRGRAPSSVPSAPAAR